MRIGSQFSRANDIRVDRPEAAAPTRKSSHSSTASNIGRVKSDIEILRLEMAGLEDDRSERLSEVKDRIARGDYFTRESAEGTADAVAKAFGVV